jgi:hypothetical protein
MTIAVNNVLVARSGLTPSFDPILEYVAVSGFPASGNSNFLYRSTDDGRIYQWTGNFYAEVGPDSGATGSATYVQSSTVVNSGYYPSALTGNVNNYAHNDADIVYLSSTGAYSITGLTSSSANNIKLLINTSSYTLTLTHQDSNSSASNRFIVPFASGYYVDSGYSVTAVYDSNASRWRLL